jgi:hypothetical protein
MLPSIARYLIRTYTQVGDWVCDPMVGLATTVVEAVHLGRHRISVEFEGRWAGLTADNIRLAASQGATGTGGDPAGRLPARARAHPGRVVRPDRADDHLAAVRTVHPRPRPHTRPTPRQGRKINHSYGGGDNLAYRDHDALADAFTQILTGAAAIL